MPELETSLEAPELGALDAPEETPDASLEAPDTPEGGEPTEEGGEPVKDESPIVAGRLSEQTLAALTAIKESNPKLAAQLKNALYGSVELKKHFPENGLKQAIELKQKWDDLGGEEGFNTLRTELSEWDGLDQKYMEAPAEFVKEVASKDPQAFVKMVSEAIAHFQELSPDGYGQYIGAQIVSDMQAANIPLIVARLADMLPTDNPKLADLFNQLTAYLDKFPRLAKQTVKPVGKAPEVNQREQELTKREQELTRTSWAGESNASRMSLFNSEWKRLGADKLSPKDQAAVKELYGPKLVKFLETTPKFRETIDKYFANGDKEGYLRFMQTKYREHIPKALLAAVRHFTPAKKAPVPAPGTKAAPAIPVPASTGFIRVASAPKRDMIDYSKTSTAMVLSGKAILSDGKRVQWR